MGKLKEDDKIEKLIRGLLKLPQNRRCINCNSLGPQYVCSTFWTFVCTNCSGVHREFTHRVKSISMAKFSMEEVNALQAGGNEKARQVYFKAWDPHRNHFPEASNIHRIRDFIKRVYVDRQFTGETHPNSDVPGFYERKRAHTSDNYTFQEKSFDEDDRYSYDEFRSPQYLRDNSKYVGIGANSSHFEGTSGSYHVDDPRENSVHGGLKNNASGHESRGGRFQVAEQRETARYGDSKASSSRFEDKNGPFQVDSTRVAGWSATQMFTTEDIKPRRRSPDRKQSSDMNNLTVGHVKEILGENSKALRIANNPKFSERRCVGTATKALEGDQPKEGHDGSDHYKTSHRRTVSANTQEQNTAISSSKPSYNNTELKPRCGSAGSLLAIEELLYTSDKLAQTPCSQPQTAIEPPVKEDPSNTYPKNTLEFLLLDLSTLAKDTPNTHSGLLFDGNVELSSSSSHQSTWHDVSAPSTREHPTFEVVPGLPGGSRDPSCATIATSSNTLSISMLAKSTDVDTSKVSTYQNSMEDLLSDVATGFEDIGRKQYSRTQHIKHSGTIVSDRSSSSIIQTNHLIEDVYNYPKKLYPTLNTQANFENSIAPSSQHNLGQTTETKSSVEMNPLADSKAGGRIELPADLFTSPYQLSSMPVSGWQTSPSYGMSLNMHYYPPQMKIPSFPNVAKSRNPFDTDDNTDQSHNTMFASKEFVQGGLTNMIIPPGMSHTANFGSHLLRPTSTGSLSYPSSFHHQPPSGKYLGQHPFQNWIPTSIQGPSGFGGERGSTVSHSTQQITYRYPTPADQNSFPTGRGNPFG